MADAPAPALTPYTPGAGVGGYGLPAPPPPAAGGGLPGVPDPAALKKWDMYLRHNTHNFRGPPKWYTDFRSLYGGGYGFGGAGGGNGTGPSNGSSGGIGGMGGQAGQNSGAGGVGPGTGGVY
jgi:hypothetical protein